MDTAIKTNYLAGAGILAEKWKMPVHAVKTRAVFLGVARTKSLGWSRNEIDILEEYSWMTPRRLQDKLKANGYHRTATAIRNEVTRLGIKGSGLGVYTATGLAQCFGVDSAVVRRWIQQGLLICERLGSDRPSDTFTIFEPNIIRFIKTHPMEFDIRKVDQLWFMDMLGFVKEFA